jgi:hypothetical protein
VGVFRDRVSRFFQSGSLSRCRAGSDVLENLRDVPGPMQNCDHRERRTGGVVHHEVRVDAPEFHRPVGQILSSVADARRSGELLESLLERRQNAKGPSTLSLPMNSASCSTSAYASIPDAHGHLGARWHRRRQPTGVHAHGSGGDDRCRARRPRSSRTGDDSFAAGERRLGGLYRPPVCTWVRTSRGSTLRIGTSRSITPPPAREQLLVKP